MAIFGFGQEEEEQLGITSLGDSFILGNTAPSYMDEVTQEAMDLMIKQELARRGYYID